MRAKHRPYLKYFLLAAIAPLILCFPLVGCSKAPPKKSTEGIEKARQEHVEQFHREMSEG
jgi:outer membrane PBP1 activator LpoA protein